MTLSYSWPVRYAELRQTNSAIRGAAYQSLRDGYREFQIMMAEDVERIETFRRWWSEPLGDTLTTQALLQVHAVLLAIMRNFESTRRQLSVGLITQADIRPLNLNAVHV